MLEIIRRELIRVSNAPWDLSKLMYDRLTMLNPEWQECVKRGYNKHIAEKNIPQWLSLYSSGEEGEMFLPHGVWDELIEYLHIFQYSHKIIDERTSRDIKKYPSTISLRSTQGPAIEKMLEHERGILVAPPGAGKTVMGIKLITTLGQRTLWVTHTSRLFKQVIDRYEKFTGRTEVGTIQGKDWHIDDLLTVAMVNSAYIHDIDKLANEFGLVILDECHHAPAKMFTDVLTKFSARWVFGLTATDFRRDKLERIMFDVIGPKIYEITRDELISAGDVLVPEYVQVYTGRDYAWLPYAKGWNILIGALVKDSVRNNMILKEVLKQSKDPVNKIVLLSSRREHCKLFHEAFSKAGLSSALALGGSVKKQNKAVEAFEQDEAQILVATYNLLGEGFDVDRINRLFLITPIGAKGKARLIQAVGRSQRVAEDKHNAIVYDYVDKTHYPANVRRDLISKGEMQDWESDFDLLGYQGAARLDTLRGVWGDYLKVTRIEYENSRGNTES